jgi:hypothetical protein
MEKSINVKLNTKCYNLIPRLPDLVKVSVCNTEFEFGFGKHWE